MIYIAIPHSLTQHDNKGFLWIWEINTLNERLFNTWKLT